MLPFDRGVVGELKVTPEDVRKTVGFGRFWPRQAHGLQTGAWTYDGLWMPPGAPAKARMYPWGDKGKSTLVLGFDKGTWTTTQADILKPPSAEEMAYARAHPQPTVAPGAAERKGVLKLDRSPYNALTGYRKPGIAAHERLDVPGKREMASRTITDLYSEALDAKWLRAQPDPRTALRTPTSEVRDHFVDPAAARLRGTPDAPEQRRFLDAVGVFKSTGSIGPPGW
ncbi:hypothetical protein KFE25_000199 [Diacronema lutheri]|uniref:Uncharacterized protein n=2 Tax=Diacronema lutheri TaxID=2081491 RepID=A0A8J6CAF2_DIALT|nr:hypothetical protein KFE25_000199 [Diacronema lutheri]